MISSEVREIVKNTFLRLSGAITQDELERRNAELDDRQRSLELGIGAMTEAKH